MLRYTDYFTKNSAELFIALESDPKGLTADAVSKRTTHFGPNTVSHQRPDWKGIFVRQWNSFFVYLLLGAVGINLFIGDWIDGCIIGIFALIYIWGGFFQEYRAENAIFRLQKFLTRYARVRRDNATRKINLEELVPGDIVLLKAGDLVPADVRFIYTNGLLIDESALTGESIPAPKSDGPVQNISDDLEATNLGFFGSTVVGGWARALVVATGKNTYFAEIFEKLAHIERPSAFENNIKSIAKFLSNLILMLAVIVFVVKGIVLHHPDPNFLIFLVAVVVAVVPEALPLVVTLSFSKASLDLAKRGTVIKRLTALEDLGSVNLICTDKTGTITENEMTLAHSWGLREERLLRLALIGFTGEQKEHGRIYDPFDRAILKKVGARVAEEVGGIDFLDVMPFDPVHRSFGILYKENNKVFFLHQGAPESIIESATLYLTENGATQPFDQKIKDSALAWFKEKGLKGERALALSIKETGVETKEISPKEHNGIVFAGLLSFVDPLKPTSREALALLNHLGIEHKIITGDAVEVAGAVGKDLGLIERPEDVMTGAEFEKLDLEAQKEAAKTTRIFARTLPMHKYKIIQALKSQYSVGFLGEGLNDIPALKIADLAIVVDNATDMARNVSDIVLLKKDLLVIAQAIETGRKTFANVMKYIRVTLAANIGNFATLAFASLILPFLPILPIQILLVNLLTDLPMIAISVDNVNPLELSRPQRYDFRSLYFFVLIFGAVTVPFDFIFFGLFFPFGVGVLQTGWFLYSVLEEIFVYFSLRSILPILKSGAPAPILALFSAGVALLSSFLVFYPFADNIFHFQTLSWQHMELIAGLLFCYLIVNEAVKAFIFRPKDRFQTQ